MNAAEEQPTPNGTGLDLHQEILDASVYAKQALIEQGAGDSFERAFNAVAVQAHATAKAKGWWDTPREDGTLIALVHAELSELLEYLRHGNPPSDHIPAFSGAEEEIADVIIRLMDLAERHGWNVGAAIVAKMAYNQGRERRHGGKEF